MTSKADKAKVDAYIKKHDQWSEVFQAARKTLVASGLEETVKWGTPTYTLDGKNLIGIAGFKNHCALWFHNGAFLKDPDKRLVNAQEGKTKGLRQWRFESGEKLPVRALKAFIKQSIENQRAGKSIKPDTKKKLNVPDELANAMLGLLQLRFQKYVHVSVDHSRQQRVSRSVDSGTRLRKLDVGTNARNPAIRYQNVG